MNLDSLCMGCMEDKGSSIVCPYCGFSEGTPPESPHHLPPRTVLAEKYMIGKALGQGGFGITYLAWEMNLDIKLAIKEFFPHGLVSRSHGTNEVITYSKDGVEQYRFGLEKFLAEAKTLARFIEHPNIVNVRDYFTANETAYMVMNYVEGITLDEYLKHKGGALSFEETLNLIMPVMDALKEVHHNGVLHRDVSPDNIFIDKNGRVILIDFGAARQELQQKSRSLSVIMKVGFSPEEQYRSKGMQGPWTDIYALAATMYKAITGEVPPESMDRLAEDQLISPSEMGFDIDQRQEEVLLKAMAVRAEDRYQSIEELYNAFKGDAKKDELEIKDGFKKCPHCGGEILVKARRCKHCYAVLSEEPKIQKIDQQYPPKYKPAVKAYKTFGLVAAAIFVVGLLVYGGIKLFEESPENEVALEDPAEDLNAGEPVVEEPVEAYTDPLSMFGPAAATGTQTIAGMFPLSGVLSSFGENSAEAAKLAADDINDWLNRENRGWTLDLVIVDTQTDGSIALNRMQNRYNDGIKFFAGPQASGVAGECLPFANNNQILFISPSATSTALAIPDDWFFRFCPDDSLQGPAIAAVAADAGVKNLIFSWRGDTWGDGLQAAAANSAQNRNIKIYDPGIRYDPSKQNLGNEVSLLNGYVDELVAQGIPLEQIGICLICFEEAASFIAEAANYSQLKDIVWIGSDGTALSQDLLNNDSAKQFAIKVNFISPMSRMPDEPPQSWRGQCWNHIYNNLNREPDVYSYNTYDIIWALALSIDQAGYDPEAVRKILPQITDDWSKTFGASGHIVLNEYGDRAHADFDYWLINAGGQWDSVGFYEGALDSIEWKQKIY